MAELFPLPNVTKDLTPFADTLVAADDLPTVSGGMAINEGNNSPINTHSEHSFADSTGDGNHNKNLPTTTADIHADSRVITNLENDSANQSLQPPLQHPPVISITTYSEGDSEGGSANQFDFANHSSLPQLAEIQLVTVLLQQSYKILSPILLDILCLIILHINISQLNILPFLLLSLMCMNHGIFKRLIQIKNGDKLCMMSYKPLIKIRPRVLLNFLKINMLWVVAGYIKSSSTQMGLLTDTRRVLWLKAILKLLAWIIRKPSHLLQR